MKVEPGNPDKAEQLTNRLLNIAVNQCETKADLLAAQNDEPVNWIAVEYEMQLLRIVAVGWALAYFAEEAPGPEGRAEAYWEGVQTYCSAVSAMTRPVLGSGADYFGTVRRRLDHYVQVMTHFSDVADPARVIGPAFAARCGCEASEAVIRLGGRVFGRCLARVQQQLLR